MLTPAVHRLVELALEEDLGRGDATSDAVLGGQRVFARGAIVARQELVVAGLEVAAEVFRRVDADVGCEVSCTDGTRLAAGESAMHLSGDARAILMAERTALNFLQRLSGVATLASRFARAVQGTGAVVVDTRKTTPGWRVLEKQAVRAGGCGNHRADLGSGILIKDNHIVAAGGVAAALEAARSSAPHGLRLEIEVDDEVQLREALDAGCDVVLLDNMTPEMVARACQQAHDRGVIVEVSGGITLETVARYATTGVDYISVGALTHSAPAVDLGLDMEAT